jgi:hypothetical protein
MGLAQQANLLVAVEETIPQKVNNLYSSKKGSDFFGAFSVNNSKYA